MQKIRRRRLLSITSIHQLVVGIVCLKRNNNNGIEYDDYLLINNILLTNQTIKDLRNFAKNYGFKKVIDFRGELELLNTKKDYSKIKVWYNRIKNILLPLFNNIHLKDTRITQNNLRFILNNQSIDEIYIRYKFNTPERIVLNTFPKANVYIFEDGAGDYINYRIDKGENSVPLRLIQEIKLNYKLIIKNRKRIINDNNNKLMYNRVNEMYELISFKYSDRKNYLFGKVSNEFINIKEDYKNAISQLYINNILNYFDFEYVLFLPSFSTPTDPKSYSEFQEIKYNTEKTLSNIKKFYSNKIIFIKSHPRIPAGVKSMLLNNFPDHLLPDKLNCFPAEVFFFDPKLIAVIGELTSSLIYASQIFDKESYYIFPSDKSFWSEDKFQSVSETMTNMGVRRLPENKLTQN